MSGGGGSGPGGNNPKYAQARRNLALELWEITAMSVAEIAEFIGVSVHSVQRYLRGA